MSTGSAAAPIEVGLVVCDDAHTAFSAIRDQFTVAVKKESQPELYRGLVGRFAKDFEELRLGGRLNDVVTGDDSILEVPHWAWSEKASAIESELVTGHSHDFRYSLPLITGSFHSCHAFITRDEFAITPIQPLVDRFPTFVEADRRIYMSATIADDSSIVQTFGAPAKAVRDPIAPQTLAGVGERMILAPGLTEMEKEDVLPTVQQMVERLADRRVVVLTPSEKIAREWEDVGEVRLRDDVATAVERLTRGAEPPDHLGQPV